MSRVQSGEIQHSYGVKYFGEEMNLFTHGDDGCRRYQSFQHFFSEVHGYENLMEWNVTAPIKAFEKEQKTSERTST